jgi:hypothetical protein
VIVNLIREPAGPADIQPAEACRAEGVGLPGHRVAAVPFVDAEAEVRRRCLRSLADRVNPPTAVLFVRTWELPLPAEVGPEPAVIAGDAPRRRGGRRG